MPTIYKIIKTTKISQLVNNVFLLVLLKFNLIVTKPLQHTQGEGIGKKSTICKFIPKENNFQICTCKTFTQYADEEKDQYTCKTNPSFYWTINQCIDYLVKPFHLVQIVTQYHVQMVYFKLISIYNTKYKKSYSKTASVRYQ
ncbi:unnamed protein product [Paramecium pentaurelia]|uniref:Uncharacterized protein n=1 Tax=Paramecium pentaurelia TaxID=43138 RepID=A0A8S1UYY6_9CILI|nr:unnamed protein product [Paramecium pentaurelia]